MTLDLNKIKKLKSDKIGFFRFKKFDKDNYLITNDIGEYSFLTSQEFGDFISGKINSGDKFTDLESKGFIKNEKYTNEMAIKYATKNHFLAYGPSLHILVTTIRCNHKCLYCHASAGNKEAKGLDMTLETAKKVLDTIFYTSSEDIIIEFQGGEPLLNWDVFKYVVEEGKIKALHLAKNIRFALVTNLTLMDEEKLDYIINNGINISTSLDGDELLHNENRIFKNGNSFEKVTYWIRKINEEYEKRGIKNTVGEFNKIGALLTVTKNALPKYKEIIDTYIALGLDGIFLRSLNPYGFAQSDLNKLSYSPEEFGEFYRNSLDYILDLNSRGVNFREQLSSIYLAKILNQKDPNYLDERSPCGACIGQLAYNYDGNVYTCDEGRMMSRMGINDFLAGEVSENPEEVYENIINSELTKTMVQSSTIDGLPGYNESVYKPYIGICPIYNYKILGNIYSNYSKDNRNKLENIILNYLFDKLRNTENLNLFNKWLGKDDITICK
ncbi:MAG: His-Xaa-Ser system radical SAM maturase HxsB [Candidatus Gracilibacteria bacterium]|nr:His-Xaa-Ser system radical SAM maturase HxsB [Candidatus Gracilibacteria bacterium]MDD2908616.1 His-Xaa-Ser system radical SAM maturase HxsB [Candidatus Gracilibacteria bacterium]